MEVEDGTITNRKTARNNKRFCLSVLSVLSSLSCVSYLSVYLSIRLSFCPAPERQSVSLIGLRSVVTLPRLCRAYLYIAAETSPPEFILAALPNGAFARIRVRTRSLLMIMGHDYGYG